MADPLQLLRQLAQAGALRRQPMPHGLDQSVSGVGGEPLPAPAPAAPSNAAALAQALRMAQYHQAGPNPIIAVPGQRP